MGTRPDAARREPMESAALRAERKPFAGPKARKRREDATARATTEPRPAKGPKSAGARSARKAGECRA